LSAASWARRSFISAVLVASWWILPPIEIFDEGGAGARPAFGKWMVAAVSAVVLSMIASFIWD
jgi:hypothetical protein